MGIAPFENVAYTKQGICNVAMYNHKTRKTSFGFKSMEILCMSAYFSFAKLTIIVPLVSKTWL